MTKVDDGVTGRGMLRSAQKNALRSPPSALRWTLLRLPVLFAAVLLLAHCDDTVLDPFKESNLHFSIGGFLDGGVDTQFVRVSPVRDSIFLGPGPLDASVTLEHLATGETTTWHDSVFFYKAVGAVSENIAHNFWSAAPLEPLATYRMTVANTDGVKSSATVTLPDTFPTPIVDGNTIKMRGIERLADVIVEYRMEELLSGRILTIPISYLEEVSRVQGEFWVFVDRSGDESDINARFLIARLQTLSIKITVAAAGPDWPDLTEIDRETLALPDVVSNIEDGVGFLGGIISKTFFWPGFEPTDEAF